MSLWQPDTVIQVQRARPVVLSADGQILQIRTHATTVGEFLAEAEVEVGPADEIWLDGQLGGSERSCEPRALRSGQQRQGGGRTPVGW